jgi:GH15 family glucan-1,4-alpha-glucosidase
VTSARYPPIGDYGFLSDCHSGALVSRTGSIDWWCVPRFDGGPCFGRLLDWDAGGYWSIEPVGPYEVTRRYLDGLVLETTFTTEDGQITLVDFFSMRRGGKRRPRRDLNRIVEGVRGEVAIQVEIVPRFDYGSVKPWIREKGRGAFSGVGGDDGIIVWSDVDLRMDSGPRLVAGVIVGRGERRHLLDTVPPARVDR